ncbi:MAG: ABC transporter permease [Planctomycetes bacterium RBG_13_50_24]|nr:MAG: ABC transporter permease [Planctomycetes bacterium RBG_13_50_24]
MTEIETDSEKWDLVISPRRGWLDLNLKGIWIYRDLVLHFVKRDFVTFYKQTILGPLWYIIQPLLTTVVFTIVFGKIAKLPTNGVPGFIFYLSGTVSWGYFSDCLKETSDTFIKNSKIFGKVYFPRLTVPLSVVIINLVKFGIQFLLFLGFLVYFIVKGESVTPNLFILLLPVLLLQMAILGLGTGILISSMTTKYRDIHFLVGFGIQLWMYATPVVYSVSTVPEKIRFFYMLNPVASIVETFRHSFLGTGMVNGADILISWAVTILILISGIILFNRVDKTFMDTV